MELFGGDIDFTDDLLGGPTAAAHNSGKQQQQQPQGAADTGIAVRGGKNGAVTAAAAAATPLIESFTGLTNADVRRIANAFVARKAVILAEIERHSAPPASPEDKDKSVKGFIDAKCLPMVELLNQHADYVTTSSCSGRICLFHSIQHHHAKDDEGDDALVAGLAQDNTGADRGNSSSAPLSSSSAPDESGTAAASTTMMKRGDDGSLGWIMVTHDHPLTPEERALVHRHTVVAPPPTATATAFTTTTTTTTAIPSAVPARGHVHFKVEPFVMHVQCRSMDAAKRLLTAALAAGYRNSGVIPPGNNVMVGIRHAGLSLDCPLVAEGTSFASSAYVDYLIQAGETLMVENERRIAKLFGLLQEMLV